MRERERAREKRKDRDRERERERGFLLIFFFYFTLSRLQWKRTPGENKLDNQLEVNNNYAITF